MTQSIGYMFSPGPKLEARFVRNFDELSELVRHLKGIGLKVVLTQGTYDFWHIGHARYLMSAKNLGDVLIVGVDSDKKVQKRKGPGRPIIPEKERVEVVAHTRYADIVTVKEDFHSHWELIKTVKPDILVVSESTPTKYSDKELVELMKYCVEVKILPPQAVTSTSAKIRLLQTKTLRPAIKKMREALEKIEEEL